MWINLILLTIYVFNGRTLNHLKANCCQHSRSLITSLWSVTIGSERGGAYYTLHFPLVGIRGRGWLITYFTPSLPIAVYLSFSMS